MTQWFKVVITMLHVCCSHRCFIWSSGVFIRTASHMSGKLYLEVFLLRGSLLTLIYLDSFIVLVKHCSSLSITLQFSMVIGWAVEWWPCIGDGVLKCSLYLSPNVLGGFPLSSSLQSSLSNVNQYIIPLFLMYGILVQGIQVCS